MVGNVGCYQNAPGLDKAIPLMFAKNRTAIYLVARKKSINRQPGAGQAMDFLGVNNEHV